MHYEQMRKQIHSGHLLAWTHRSWRSLYDLQVQAVRVFTQSEYCHVGIAWRASGRVFVLEAVKPKVRIYPLSSLGDFYWLPLPVHWSETVEEFAMSKIGTPYPPNLRQIHEFIKGPLQPDGTLQCAQYAHAVLAAAGIDLDCRLTPSDLVRTALQSAARGCHLVIQ